MKRFEGVILAVLVAACTIMLLELAFWAVGKELENRQTLAQQVPLHIRMLTEEGKP